MTSPTTLTEPVLPPGPAPEPAPAYAADRWNALGTYAGLVVADAERLGAARAACERILATVDVACSRFRPDSDLVRANRNAGEWVQVRPLLIRAVAEAIRVAEDTGGLVDPALGGHLAALGYDRDLAEVLRDGRSARLSPAVTPDAWRRIDFGPDGEMRIPAGVALDLGATGKAFAADLIAATVPALTGTALVISLGGDVAVGALGTGPAHSWPIAVAERPEDVLGAGWAEGHVTGATGAPGTGDAELVVLEEGALATSSTLARRWTSGTEVMHHLLDPRTGRPVEAVWRTVSVCAGTCLDANAASTAAIVLGERAPEWLAERDLAARLVGVDGRVLRIAGWPEVDPAP